MRSWSSVLVVFDIDESNEEILVPGLTIKVAFPLLLVLNAETQSSRSNAEVLTIFSAILCGLGVSAMKTTRCFI
jgi:hypothetical protein